MCTLNILHFTAVEVGYRGFFFTYAYALVCTLLYSFLVSEDTRSMDMTIQNNEDRGFYTDTFHSSAWIYQGDDVDSGAIPSGLNTRTRAVSSKLEIL